MRFGTTCASIVLALFACSSDDGEGSQPSDEDAATSESPNDAATSADASSVGSGSGDAAASTDAGGGSGSPACDVMVNEADCDETKLPFVFVHGTFGSAQDFSLVASLMGSNGYCADRIVGVDYNSLGGGPAAELDALIPALKEKFGVDKVDIGGHSQGTGHASRYVTAHPADFAHYVHMAGGNLTADPGGVPTLCLSSIGDRPVNCTTARNFIHQDVEIDHYAVAAAPETFVEIFKFLNDDEEPTYTEIQCGDPVMIEGRVMSYGDATPLAGGTFEVFEVGDDPRDLGDPLHTFEIPATGFIPAFEGKRGVLYEFRYSAAPGDPRSMRRHYQTPMLRSDRLIRFLFPSTSSLFTTSTNAANYSENHSVLVARLRHGAFLSTRDTLTVNGSINVVNEQNAGLGMTTVAIYMFDDGNQMTDGGLPPGFTSAFVKASDVFMGARDPGFLELVLEDSSRPQFNQTMRIPNWPSCATADAPCVDPNRSGAIVNFY